MVENSEGDGGGDGGVDCVGEGQDDDDGDSDGHELDDRGFHADFIGDGDGDGDCVQRGGLSMQGGDPVVT